MRVFNPYPAASYFALALFASNLSTSAAPACLAAEASTGWFSKSQAATGADIFRGSCAACHGNDLSGHEPAPALIGGVFLSKWGNSTVADLLERVRSTMPLNDPRSLSDSQYAAVIAYILRCNNFRVGVTDLPGDPTLLVNYSMADGKP